jgi:hypothetical protein
MREEAACGQLGLLEIAAGETRAADIELARETGWNELLPWIEKVHLHVRKRETDGQARGRATPPLRRIDLEGAVDRRLGRAIEVAELHVEAAKAALCELPGEGLAAAENPAQGATGLPHPLLLEKHRQMRWDELQHGHLVLGDDLLEIGVVALPSRNCEHQASPGQQWKKDLPDRSIEAVGRLLQQDVIGAEREGALHPQKTVQDRPVRHHDTLGPSRRTRGIDHIGEMLRARAPRLLAFLHGRAVDAEDAAGKSGKAFEQALLGEQQERLRVIEHVGQAVARVLWIERYVSPAGLQDGQHPDHHLERPLDRQRDPDLRPDAQTCQEASELRRPPIELVKRQAPACVHQRDPVRRPARLRREERGDRRVGAGGAQIGIRGVEVENLPTLRRREQPKIGDPALRLCQSMAQKDAIPGEHSFGILPP